MATTESKNCLTRGDQHRQGKLQTEHEHQKDDAKLGHEVNFGGIAKPGETMWTDKRTDYQIADDGWHTKASTHSDN